MTVDDYFDSGYWFLAYSDNTKPGTIVNTVISQRPFDWLLSDKRYERFQIVFFCKIKRSRYEQLLEVLP